MIYIIKNEELRVKNGRQRAGPLCRSEIPRGYASLDDARADALLIGAGEGAKGSLPSVSWLVHGWDEAEWVVAD